MPAKKAKRLTSEQKAKVLELSKQGIAAEEISKQVGCSAQTVYYVRSKAGAAAKVPKPAAPAAKVVGPTVKVGIKEMLNAIGVLQAVIRKEPGAKGIILGLLQNT